MYWNCEYKHFYCIFWLSLFVIGKTTIWLCATVKRQQGHAITSTSTTTTAITTPWLSTTNDRISPTPTKITVGTECTECWQVFLFRKHRCNAFASKNIYTQRAWEFRYTENVASERVFFSLLALFVYTLQMQMYDNTYHPESHAWSLKSKQSENIEPTAIERKNWHREKTLTEKRRNNRLPSRNANINIVANRQTYIAKPSSDRSCLWLVYEFDLVWNVICVHGAHILSRCGYTERKFFLFF